jgi:putative hydrolase of the HAD superfamily
VNGLQSNGLSGPLKAVVFDMDDTLYLEHDYVLSGFRHIAGLIATDARRSPEDIFTFLKASTTKHQHRGHNLDLLFEEYPGLGCAWDVSRLVEEYRCHNPTISLLPGVPSMLSDLRDAGAHLAVITDGASQSQHRKVKALQLARHVDMVIVTDDYGMEYRKPHPYAYLRVPEKFGCEPGACVYIGDNPAKDFLAPRVLGWDTVRIRLPNQLHAGAEPLVPEAAPRVECGGIVELRRLLISRLTQSHSSSEARSWIA